MKALSLFSGIGLHDLGLQRAGWEIAGQVEIDPWCRAVLEKHWPSIPRWEDVRDVTAVTLSDLGEVGLVTGGFPCPDISSAGRGVGLLRGERSSLWLEMLRIIGLIQPAWVLAENVPALRTRGIDSVLAGLEEAGYAAWPVVVGAWAVGAPHRRDRVWIIGRRVEDAEEQSRGTEAVGTSEGMGNAERSEWRPREEVAARGIKATDGFRRSGAAGMADANSGALRLESESELGSGGAPEPGEVRWPARRGEPQHAWEPPRLVNSASSGRRGSGRRSVQGEPSIHSTSGGEAGSAGGEGMPESGLGRGADGRPSRLDGFARRNRLKALGNANPPQIPELIGRWMIEAELGVAQSMAGRGR